MKRLEGRTIALCLTGSIAAYKAVEVARLCLKEGAKVIPVMTPSAAKFVGPVTLAGICGEAVHQDMWDPAFAGELHVSLAARADAVALVPTTADLLARLAHGRADDLVACLALCARGPVVAAPAMHPRMWEHPATQRNVQELLRQGRVTLVGPVRGPVASGEEGMGRMVEPAQVVDGLVRSLAPRDLTGARIVVTAGPTVEDVDPVRFLGNRSSGKMGFAVAERAALRGAEVLLIAGPVALETPAGVRRLDVRSALAMRQALWAAAGADLGGLDALIMAAAVADYRPATVSETKVKKEGETLTLPLVRNPDILAEVGATRRGPRPVLVGFAVETTASAEPTEGGSEGPLGPLLAYARGKLGSKKVDLVVANEAQVAFGADDNRAVFVSEAGDEVLQRMSKARLADLLLDRVRARLVSVGVAMDVESGTPGGAATEA